jgi:hypothetical protein
MKRVFLLFQEVGALIVVPSLLLEQVLFSGAPEMRQPAAAPGPELLAIPILRWLDLISKEILVPPFVALRIEYSLGYNYRKLPVDYWFTLQNECFRIHL